LFYANYESAFKKAYGKFLNTREYSVDFKYNGMLDFEYYNANWYYNIEFDNLWLQFQNDLDIIFKESKLALSLFSIIKFKSLYTIKTFKFSFHRDVLDDPEPFYNIKPKSKTIPDFEKLQV
jgi:hypothetical protein